MKRKEATIITGLLITAYAYIVYMNPFGISVGGITGLAVLAEKHAGIPNTITLLVLNIGLFIAGVKLKGWKYIIRSFVAMLLLGILLDLPIQPPPVLMPHTPASAMVVGSILSGIGYGMIVATDTSTGGSDFLGHLVVKKFPQMTVGLTMNLLDLLVISLTAILEGGFLFSLIAVLLCNTTLDLTAFALGGEIPAWIMHLKRISKGAIAALHKRIITASCKNATNACYCALGCCLIIICSKLIMNTINSGMVM